MTAPADYLIHAYDIEWDTDGETVEGLPSEYVFPSSDGDTEMVADWLTDTFDWCVAGCEVAIYKKVEQRQ